VVLESFEIRKTFPKSTLAFRILRPSQTGINGSHAKTGIIKE